MREMIWELVTSRIPDGEILPWWALAVRAVLYPLSSFYWRFGKTTGYQWDNDTWLIHGVKYSGGALRWMSKAQGEIYRITRTGDTVTLEKIK